MSKVGDLTGNSSFGPGSILVGPRVSVIDITRTARVRHLVTCMHDGAPPTPEGIEPDRHLTLAMHDIEGALAGYTPPGLEHAEQLLHFMSSWDQTSPVLIHCYAGVSRSTAAAFISLCALNPDMDEALIAMQIRQASPKAQPNRLFVSHADALLGRGGRMSRAIEEIGPGDLVGLNTPFVLPAILS